MTDPTLLFAGQLLTVQRLASGEPVAGAAVTARAEGGGHPIMGRTDASGHVTLPIDRDGAWLVRTVHMVSGAQAGLPSRSIRHRVRASRLGFSGSFPSLRRRE